MVYEVWFPHLGIMIEKLPRVLISLGGFSIYTYGFCIALGVLAGALYAYGEAKRTGQNPDVYLDYVVWVLMFSIVGARLYYVAFSWDTFRGDWLSILNLRTGGLAIYGGVLAAVVTTVVYAKVRKMDFWVMADTAAPGLALGQAIGRIGNLFNREVFGGATDSLFAMRYWKEQVDFLPREVLERLVVVDGIEYIQVHPTFLYESIWNVGVFLALIWFVRRKKVDGEVFLAYFMGYGLGRFWIEGIRVDQLYLWGTGVPVSQALSVVLMAVALGGFWIRRKKFRAG